MPAKKTNNIITRLAAARLKFSPADARATVKILAAIGRENVDDASEIIRLHEALLFIRAYPANREVLTEADRLLASFSQRVERLKSADADLSELEDELVSGIAATSVSAPFSFSIVSWLTRRYPGLVSIDWARHDGADRLGATLPRFLPLLSEDSLVEANVPYAEWIREAASGVDRELSWLVRRFENLQTAERGRAELYDSLGLQIRVRLTSSRVTRTGMFRPAPTPFFHRSSLIKRADVSIARDLASRDLAVERLSRKEGSEVLDMARAASVVRYRELHGFTHGDSGTVDRMPLGRGVEVFLAGVGAQHRLPLRAYHAGFILKNGVPIGYVETLSLFDRTEIGFNLYYTFRDGESAWLYSRVLKLFHQLIGVRYFVLDPYQLGLNNEEAIESGAFWFYRKLGFRPTDGRLAQLMAGEEKKVATKPGYRSPARVLRRLAQSSMVYEAPGALSGYWDRFKVRNLGLAVQRRTAERFGGEPLRMVHEARSRVAEILRIDPPASLPGEQSVFDNLAAVLSLIPDLDRWRSTDRRLAAAIVRAKLKADEMKYLAMLRRHKRLGEALRALGSAECPD